jgi:hypothetical protein
MVAFSRSLEGTTMRTRVLSSLTVLALAVALTACSKDSGFGDKSVADIKAAALTDMKTLSTLHLAGSIAMTEGDVALDMDVSTSGDCSGTMTIKGGTAQILSVGGTSYLKGDEAFWTANAGAQAQAVIALVGDKWLKTGGSDAQLAELCDLDKFVDGLDKDKGGTGDTKGEITEINGVDAIEISSEKDGATTHAWVAVDGRHYIVKLETTGGDQPGTMTFTDFDKELSLTAPPADEVADLGQ